MSAILFFFYFHASSSFQSILSIGFRLTWQSGRVGFDSLLGDRIIFIFSFERGKLDNIEAKKNHSLIFHHQIDFVHILTELDLRLFTFIYYRFRNIIVVYLTRIYIHNHCEQLDYFLLNHDAYYLYILSETILTRLIAYI